MSKILNKIFDKDLYNTVKAERYELDYSGNKVMYNIEQLEGLAEQEMKKLRQSLIKSIVKWMKC